MLTIYPGRTRSTRPPGDVAGHHALAGHRRLGRGIPQRRHPLDREGHPCHADPAGLDHRRLRAGVRRTAAPGRRDRRQVRPASRADRRTRDLRRRVRRGDDRHRARGADRHARAARRRSGAGHACDVVDDHQHLSCRAEGASGRRLGGCRGCERHPRPADLRAAARGMGVAVGLRHERRAGRGRDHRCRALHPGVRRSGCAPTGPRGRRAHRRGAGRPRVLGDRGSDPRLGQRGDHRWDRDRAVDHGRVRRLGGQAAPPAPRPPVVPAPGVHGSDPVDHRAVLRVLRPRLPDAAVPPAGPR